MERLAQLEESDLTDAQRAYLNGLAQGPRGQLGLVGPFGVWARVPELGEALQKAGAAVRFETALPDNLREVAICTVGAFHRARFEFAAHKRIGMKAGLDEQALDRLAAGGAPGFEGDEAVVHQFAQALLRDHHIGQGTYDAALQILGEAQLIELVTTIGYYCLISHTLNAFEVGLPDGMIDPFPLEQQS